MAQRTTPEPFVAISFLTRAMRYPRLSSQPEEHKAVPASSCRFCDGLAERSVDATATFESAVVANANNNVLPAIPTDQIGSRLRKTRIETRLRNAQLNASRVIDSL